MKNKYMRISFLIGILSFACFACEDLADPIVEELNMSRAFAPIELTARVRNLTTIELDWNIRGDADHYVVEFSEDSLEFNTIIFTDEVTAAELPYQHTFAGETRYSARVKSVGIEGLEDSKWTTVTVETAAENIYLPLPGENVQDTYVTLIWTAGSEVTHFLLNPGNITRAITVDEKAAGKATVEGLDGSTNYTATLYNGNKRRGTVSFSTSREANVFPTDNLATVIGNAAEGAVLVLAPGTYNMGAVALTKSITLEGQKAYDKPIVYGQLTCGATVASVSLKSVVFRGNAEAPGLAQFFNTTTGCNLTSLSIVDCEISNYTNGLIYNNVSGTYGTISISNSFIHSMAGSGGDGIDFRGGTIGAFTVENTTFANGFRNFFRMQVACNASFKNCTFYKVSIVDGTNNNGLFRMNKTVGGSLEVRSCLFVETGVQNPTAVQAGNWCRQDTYMVGSPVYANNNIHSCYNLLVGLYTTATQVSATELNPSFVDAANGNFKVTNQALIDNKVGDPRWLQ